ncbi:MAG: acyltransferase [Brevinema sp.]
MIKQDLNIVWTRALACLLVVLIHVAEQWHYTYNNDSGVFYLTSLMMVLGRPSVPLFFMISGYLLFSKDEKPSSTLVWKRFQTIFRPLIFFFIVYYLYQISSGNGWNPIGSAFLQKNVSHLWYLGFMLPVYTFSAFIRPPRIENIKQCLFFLMMILVIFIITESMMTKPYPFLADYSFNQPLLYMMIGYLLKHISLKKKSIGLKLLFLSTFLLLTLINYVLILIDNNAYLFTNSFLSLIVHILEYIFGNQGTILGSYKTIGVLLQSIFLFLFLQSLQIERMMSQWRQYIHKFVNYISTHSLNIYGWHILFLNIIRELLIHLQIRYAFPILFLTAVPCSVLAGYATKYTSVYIKKYLENINKKI